ncbi:MAG: BlaI/MecI/CopY family transcriptional regulator [Firmicutes bacterium]|uniref:BlaI/MecI/CopY family transcriptional regulator n=1 Tax=Candidatus Scybalomonas excrementavium TaxID=2840943 RepID=A0A9D9N8F9_9FIRM|nr:BlaI/MecI/CopY family transcriptional regulator [Candidatus Scybalomonas excrementavium]
MEQYKLGEMEQRFAEIIWDNEPVTSRTLTKLCEKEFGWKRTTTYTMLKRLCDREIFKNDGGMVIALMSKSEFKVAQGEKFISEIFHGSLPQFLAAFSRHKKLSKRDINEIQKLIDEYKEE